MSDAAAPPPAATPTRATPAEPTPGPPHGSGVSSATGRNALVVIAVLLSVYALHWLADILTPLALALFVTIMIDGMARAVKRYVPVVPERAALPLAILMALLLTVATVYVVADNGSAFVGQLLTYGPRLNALISQGAHLVGVQVPPTITELLQRLNPARFIAPVWLGLQGFAADAAFVLIYTGFLLASRAAFQKKLGSLFPSRGDRAGAERAFRRIRDGVEGYLWIQTVTGAIIAVASYAVMALVGLNNALFWAFLIFIVGYVPIIGGVVGVAFPPLFALVQFETYWPAVILLAALQAINFVVGNVILPRMQGQSLNMDPVVVLLALAFWGAIWGMAGAFLSTPLTVMAMVILAQFPGSRWIAVLLSGDGDPDGAGGGERRRKGDSRAKRKITHA